MHPQNNVTHMFQTSHRITLLYKYTIQTVSRKYSTKSIDSQTTCPYSLQTHYHSCTFPLKHTHTHKKQKQETSLSIYPSIHPFIQSSIYRGPHNSFYIIFIYLLISLPKRDGPHDENPWDLGFLRESPPQKNRWCESFNLANHLGKPPWRWSRRYFGFGRSMVVFVCQISDPAEV